MKKIYILLAIAIGYDKFVFADDNSSNALFQSMDNQIGLGYSYSSMHAYNSNNSDTAVNTNSSYLNLHIEKLFDSNVWSALDAGFAFKASQTNPPGTTGFNTGAQEFGFPANLGLKVGYSFNKEWEHNRTGLQVIPYATIGRALNYNGVSIAQNTFNNSNLNQFGIGGRIEYIFTPGASIYFDQSLNYWQDPNNDTFNQTSMNYTSLLGIKYNPTEYFQISLQGMFNQTELINNSGYDAFTYTYQNVNQTNFAGMLTFAYLYDHDQLMSKLANDATPNVSKSNSLLSDFDNTISLGYGIASSNNSYSSGNLPTINSSLSYFNMNITHLFDSNVWADLNAQLMNNISQTNIQSGIVNATVPTYIGFPGNITGNVGYGFQAFNSGFQVIPFANVGMIMNMNSYNIRSNSSIMGAISQDRYLQYGLGARLEYAIDNFWQIYGSQLFAGMNDQSPLSINAMRSTTSLGIKINPGSVLQFGLSGYYDLISPQGTPYSNITNSPVAAKQTTIGGQFDIGIRY